MTASLLAATAPRGPAASAGCWEYEENSICSMHSIAVRSLAAIRWERRSTGVGKARSPRLLIGADAYTFSFSSGVSMNEQPVPSSKTKQ